MKHASFFSGVGGLDLGFERAGIETVSVSEIDPYANTVLAERFPSAPNLGSITEVNANDIPEADIWSGGFPCQDLSVAGKRAGFAGKRSSLAFTFLDLVEQRRPRWLVLENVPGLFSSNQGADFGRLIYEMEQLRYGVSWRTLDARYFGVAQRRRRVFLVASLESDRAAEVLLECEGCERHPSPRWTQGQSITSSIGGGADASGNRQANRRDISAADSDRDSTKLQHPSFDSDRVRAADGMARRMDNQQSVDTFGKEIHRTLQARDWKIGVSNQDINILAGEEAFLVGQPIISFPSAYSRQPTKFNDVADPLTLSAGAPAVMSFPRSLSNHATRFNDQADPLTVNHGGGVNTPAVFRDIEGVTAEDDDLVPLGLDSHRYRCCGNGVVAPVAEWIGRRIVEVDRRWREEVK